MFDYGFEVQDSATFTVSAAGTVSSVAKIADLGAAKMHGELVIDVTQIELLSNDETYDIVLQGSESSSFAGTITSLARLRLGAKEILQGSADVDSTAFEHVVPSRDTGSLPGHLMDRTLELIRGEALRWRRLCGEHQSSQHAAVFDRHRLALQSNRIELNSTEPHRAASG